MSKNQIQQQKIAVHSQKFGLKTLCCGVLFAAMSSVGFAATKTLSLESAIDKVETYQLSQNMWATQTEIDQANLAKAKLWKNPQLSLEQTGFDSKEEQEFSVSISQELDVFGVRKANQNLVVFSQEKMLLAQKIYTAQMRLTVKYLWSQLAIAELEKNIVQAQLSVSEANLNAIQKRFQAGSVAEVDLKRAQLSHTESIRLFKQADLQVQLAQQQLSNIWGASDKTIQIQLAANRLWPQDSHQNAQAYLAENYFEKSRILQLKNTQAELAYIQAARRPNPTVSLGMNRTKAPENGNENQIMLGVSVPLNIFDRQQHDVKINQYKQDALNRQQVFYAQQNALQVGTLLTQLQSLEAQFKDVETTQLPLATEVQQKTLLGFSAGKFALTDVQQATLQLQEIRQRKVELLKAAWQIAISAESLSLGIEPNVVMSADAIAQINQTLWDNIQTSPVVGGN